MNDELPLLRSILEGRLLSGPEVFQLNLGNRCNLNCIFCWNHSPMRTSPPNEWHRQRLSQNHLDNIIESLPRLRPGRVQLSGRGEPLLHPGAEELLESLATSGIPVTIQTNGLGKLEPERLVELGVERLSVNISAGTREAYERVHPGRGHLFDNVVTRLTRIAELANAEGPRITLIAVIQRSNADQLLPLVELAHRIGAVGVDAKGLELIEGLEGLRFTEELDGLGEELDRVRARAEELGISFESKHLEQVLENPSRRGRFTPDLASGPCYMGWAYLRVTCDGRVMFCCKDKLVDHLDRMSLIRIWRSPAYQFLRLAGRDSDLEAGLFDRKCGACSNFRRNRELARVVSRG